MFEYMIMGLKVVVAHYWVELHRLDYCVFLQPVHITTYGRRYTLHKFMMISSGVSDIQWLKLGLFHTEV